MRRSASSRRNVDGQQNDYTVVGEDQFTIKTLSPGRHELDISLQHADHSPVGPRAKIDVTVARSGARSNGGSSSGSKSGSGSGSGGGGYGY